MISTPYNDEGYQKLTEQQIVKEKEDLYGDLFDIVNHSVSDILWQWNKNSIYERQEIEALHEIAAEMMSISTAKGAFLDKFGIECGIERKGATKSEGYVEATKEIDKAPFTIPDGTHFSTAVQTYISDDKNTIPYEVTLTKTKTGESDDYFSSNFDSIEEIENIVDENGNVIDSDYYVLDSVYKNNIQWTVASSAVLSKNEQYTVRLTGEITYRVEVSSENEGENTYTSVATISKCTEFPGLTITNREVIEGGTEKETDEHYRTRLLAARRRTFTIANIKSIVDGLEGVRNSKVYQVVGTDQSSVADWDDPNKYSIETLSGTDPMWSQAFVPGDQIATLGKITLYGTPYNDPPAIFCGIKRDVDNDDLDDYFDYISVERYEMDQSATGMRDIEFEVKYNGMDKTKTYRFDIWCDDPNNPSFDWDTHNWSIQLTDEDYSSELTDERGMLYKKVSGAWIEQGTGADLMFKTHFNGAGFNVIVAPEDGYGFTNLKINIESLLDYVEEGGYSPVCIQSTILEADEVLIDVKGIVWITALADFQDVRRDIVTKIEEYLEGLIIGENVVYSMVFCAINDCQFVTKIEDVYIKRSTKTEWEQIDIGILADEIPDLGSRLLQRG